MKQYLDFTTKPGFGTLWDTPADGRHPIDIEAAVNTTGEERHQNAAEAAIDLFIALCWRPADHDYDPNTDEFTDRDEARLYLASWMLSQSPRGVASAAAQALFWTENGR